MAKFVAVSREAAVMVAVAALRTISSRPRTRWRQIVLGEVVHVGSWMPIVFIEEAGRYGLMAMMSPMPGHNLFVGPDGEWLGGYLPSSLRSHPFRLVRREGSEQMTLYIDEDSGLDKDADEAGEPFRRRREAFLADLDDSGVLAPDRSQPGRPLILQRPARGGGRDRTVAVGGRGWREEGAHQGPPPHQ